MASLRSQEATSSRSRFAHHVLLSRASDTRWTFSDHLYTALVGAGFLTFRVENDDEIERDEDVKIGFERAIEESRSCIIVFSKDYVCSRSCLDALVMILERKRGSKYVVFPIFYDLDPSQVRKQSGVVGEAFERHKAQFEDCEFGKIEEWREALREVADLAGLVLQNQADGYESKFIKIIVEEIANKMDRTVLSVTLYPTGIDSRVKDINLWLQDGSSNIGIMVIYGMGGIGKTTIAKTAYNQNFERFDGSSFLANIRDTSKQPRGLVRLQKQLLSDIVKRKKEKLHNIDEGIIKIKDAMCCKRVLVVLDDVDQLDQLNAIFGMRDWFHPGSKIIITTRHKRMLKAYEAHTEALCLFCRHAFGQDHPVEAYMQQSIRIVSYCNGLPLALEVLGCSLSGESVDVWESALAKLRTFSDVKIHNVRQVSYECLDDQDKDLFLDIVCFFVGEDKDYMVTILDGCDFYTEVGVQNLIRRCLVYEVDKKLMMHQLLSEMGREIIRQASPKELGRRSRVWDHNDAFSVLKEKTGTKTIEGLILDLPELKEDMRTKHANNAQHHFEDFPGKSTMIFEDEAVLETDAFSPMIKLRILQLYDVPLSRGYDEFPKKLRWLCWHGFPLTFIPNDFPLDSMVVLDLPHSSLRQFWKGTNKLLKILNLSRSCDLTSSPDFSKLPNLERLILKDCINLAAKILGKFQGKFVSLIPLKNSNLSGCSKLDELPTDLCKMESLREFEADGVNLLSSTTGKVKSWHGVIMSLVSKPTKSLEFSLASLPSFLVCLSLADCGISDDSFPRDISSMPLLQALRLSNNPISGLPVSIRNLSVLKQLDLERCTRLRTLPELPMTLQALSIYGCKSLQMATNLPNLLNSLMLSSYGCVKLVHVQELFKLEPIGNFYSEMIQSLGLAQLESMGSFEVELFNNLTLTKTKTPVLQGLYECGIYSIFLPRNEVPGWFSIKNTGSSISFNVPSPPSVKVRGLNVCVSYALNSDYMKSKWMYECIRVNNKTKGLKWTYWPAFTGIADEGRDMIWLSDWKIADQLMNGGD
ncbi:unnamed protein product [Camellia sinensis]